MASNRLTVETDPAVEDVRFLEDCLYESGMAHGDRRDISQSRCFFYGLCMDMGVLQQRGLDPSNPQVAYLDGYTIEIRDRATLVPHAEARVYGIVTGLTHADIATLYAEPSVLGYRPEAVVVPLGPPRGSQVHGSGNGVQEALTIHKPLARSFSRHRVPAVVAQVFPQHGE